MSLIPLELPGACAEPLPGPKTDWQPLTAGTEHLLVSPSDEPSLISYSRSGFLLWFPKTLMDYSVQDSCCPECLYTSLFAEWVESFTEHLMSPGFGENHSLRVLAECHLWSWAGTLAARFQAWTFRCRQGKSGDLRGYSRISQCHVCFPWKHKITTSDCS